MPNAPGSLELRRSARKRLCISYAPDTVEDDDEPELPGQKLGRSSGGTALDNSTTQPAVEATNSSKDTLGTSTPFGTAACGTPASARLVAKRRKGCFSDDEDDLDFGAAPSKKKKKQKMLQRVSRDPMKIYKVPTVLGDKVLSDEERAELLLRKICETVQIPFYIFSRWPKDPSVPSLKGTPFLPTELWLLVFQNCRTEGLVSLSQTCGRFRALLQEHESVWTKSRIEHYPSGLGTELPLELSEAEIWDLAQGTYCDRCKSDKKVKVYWGWAIRLCTPCVLANTLKISKFRELVKKKCDNEDGWSNVEREQLMKTLYWQHGPNWTKLCWSALAFQKINEATESMLLGDYEDWLKENEVSRNAMESDIRTLEGWATAISRSSTKDIVDTRETKASLQKYIINDWCEKLPVPGFKQTYTHLNTYWRLVHTNTPSGIIPRNQFITSIPQLLDEHAEYLMETSQKNELTKQYNLLQKDLVDRTIKAIFDEITRRKEIDEVAFHDILITAISETSRNAMKLYVNPPKGTLRQVSSYAKLANWQLNHDHMQDLVFAVEERLQALVDDAFIPSGTRAFLENGCQELFSCPYHKQFNNNNNNYYYHSFGLKPCGHAKAMTLGQWARHLKSEHSGSDYSLSGSVWSNVEWALKLDTRFAGLEYVYAGTVPRWDAKGKIYKVTEFNVISAFGTTKVLRLGQDGTSKATGLLFSKTTNNGKTVSFFSDGNDIINSFSTFNAELRQSLSRVKVYRAFIRPRHKSSPVKGAKCLRLPTSLPCFNGYDVKLLVEKIGSKAITDYFKPVPRTLPFNNTKQSPINIDIDMPDAPPLTPVPQQVEEKVTRLASLEL